LLKISGNSASLRAFGASALWLVVGLGCGRTAEHATNGAAPGGASSSGGAVAVGGNAGAAVGAGGDNASSDEGVVPMHRLRAAEYKNTLRDLLGVMAAAAPEVDTTPPWDAVVDDYSAWLYAATAVASTAFKDSVTTNCMDDACASAFIDSFGLKAFRRPLRDEERQAFGTLHATLTTRGLAPKDALQQVVRAMLASAQFIFHMEPTDQPDADVAKPLDSYALASRLSYALWSTLPDDALFELAAKDGLQTDGALRVQLDRLEADARASAVGAGFAEIWLGLGGLAEHEVDTNAFPAWTPNLAAAMGSEARAFMSSFLGSGTPLKQLLTLDKNFVESSLARLYGWNPSDFPASGAMEVAITTDERRGLLGLAAFLSATSLSARASPSRRGAAIRDRLLCAPPPSHPLGLDIPQIEMLSGTLRQRLEYRTKDPVCASCHQLFDGYGLALGAFDGIGKYVNFDGGPVDAKVTLESGADVNGLVELTGAISKDDRFFACVPKRIAEYVIGRGMGDVDAELLTQLADGMRNDQGLPEQLRQIAFSHAFRYRGNRR
jgi:Protein of unknown function (DUF1592)/Protein of unknown function (DUF1588)/Protein of unknown function (DUF1595)/Protein of unknown function (DUF1585)